MPKFQVVLNGLPTNPWHPYGLVQNPFPQIPKYEVAAQMLHLAALGGDPIPDTDYIRRHLKGWSSEFVELCCSRFRPGEEVKFTVSYPD